MATRLEIEEQRILITSDGFLDVSMEMQELQETFKSRIHEEILPHKSFLHRCLVEIFMG